jgi:hypothetical protein
VYAVPYVAKEMPPFKPELASDTPTSSSEGERLGRWRNCQEALLNKTKVMRRGCSKVVFQPFVLALVVIIASKPAKWQTLLPPTWSLQCFDYVSTD